ncbi:hypothetical protein EIN_056940 [Entamoeba invadens IP1]|uniref:hypothetical protein n=1 Tax=Entamoeba invadens IP1 TaxID=370355 RepID=UPI0002C3F963|nr:hypothetical protein EIN_056940 [Entamoeba invadens IP1]ELP93309.1 hypothetical protein EIN_056940 [Entamoeba invadens IP1]|eukprot:XP_004260080.1 hypothetical protein EIN_056940 [Entamoeba invadens IP1]
MDSNSSNGTKSTDPARLKERKYNSVVNETIREMVYISVLNYLGFSFLFVKPKKFIIRKTLPFLHIDKCYDYFGNVVFSYEQLRNEALELKIGTEKKDGERRITQYIKNRTINSLIETIQSHQFIITSEVKSSKAITVNTTTPLAKKLDLIIMFDGANHYSLNSLSHETFDFMEGIYMEIFQQAIKLDLYLSPSLIQLNSILTNTPNSQQQNNTQLQTQVQPELLQQQNYSFNLPF